MKLIEIIKSWFSNSQYQTGYDNGWNDAYNADQQDTKYLEQQAYEAGRRDMLKFICEELEHERIPIDPNETTGTHLAKRLKKHLATIKPKEK